MLSMDIFPQGRGRPYQDTDEGSHGQRRRAEDGAGREGAEEQDGAGPAGHRAAQGEGEVPEISGR